MLFFIFYVIIQSSDFWGDIMTQHDAVNDLKSKLYTEVQMYDSLKKEYNDLLIKRDVLGDLLDILNSEDPIELKNNYLALGLQLPSVYGMEEGTRLFDKMMKNTQLFTTSISKQSAIYKKILDDFQKFSNQLIPMKQQLYRDFLPMIEKRRILSNFKFDGLITGKQIEIIDDLIKRYDIDSKDHIRCLEYIRGHNSKIKNSEYFVSDTVVKMLDSNYTKFIIDDVDDIKYKDRYSRVIEDYLCELGKTDVKDLPEFLPFLPDFTEYPIDVFDYIYQNLINGIIDSINEDVEYISSVEVYKSIELRKVAISEYNERRIKLAQISNYYYAVRSNYQSDVEILDVEESNSNDYVNNLLYLNNSNNISYLEKDMKSFPEEYFERVSKLLDSKRRNTLTPTEDKSFSTINAKLKDYSELRDDQVRIVYKHVGNNNYLILGAYVKKVDNFNRANITLAKRDVSIDYSNQEVLNNALLNAEEVEKRIANLVEIHGRKGNR